MLPDHDEIGPPARAPARSDGRRLTAGLMLIVLVLAWSAVAIGIGQGGAALATHIFPARIVQTWTGTVAPGPDFQPLRITVAAEVDGADGLRPRDANLLVLRSPTTMRRGSTAPLRFAANAPPATADVVTWLVGFGVAPTPTAEQAATEALAVVRGAATARTRTALHALRLDQPTQPRPEDLMELKPQAPAWIELAVTIVALLAGAVPITIAIVRYAQRH